METFLKMLGIVPISSDMDIDKNFYTYLEDTIYNKIKNTDIDKLTNEELDLTYLKIFENQICIEQMIKNGYVEDREKVASILHLHTNFYEKYLARFKKRVEKNISKLFPPVQKSFNDMSKEELIDYIQKYNVGK